MVACPSNSSTALWAPDSSYESTPYSLVSVQKVFTKEDRLTKIFLNQWIAFLTINYVRDLLIWKKAKQQWKKQDKHPLWIRHFFLEITTWDQWIEERNSAVLGSWYVRCSQVCDTLPRKEKVRDTFSIQPHSTTTNTTLQGRTQCKGFQQLT